MSPLNVYFEIKINFRLKMCHSCFCWLSCRK